MGKLEELYKVGDEISFYTSCNCDRTLYVGSVQFDEGLGLITIIDNIKYELRKMVDLKKIDTKTCVCLNWHRAIQPNMGRKAICSNCNRPRS